MSASAISFTYEDRFGHVGEIDLSVMRKLWVDGERAGVVFAEPAANGQETLHEVIVTDRGTTDAMVAVMESLLDTPALERVEAPVARPSLVLEFRTPRPQVVALAARY
jgi:hypothetical protein